MKNFVRKIRPLKAKIMFMQMNNVWFRHLQGMSATIRQWFALDLEPPSCGLVRCNTTLGEKPFYNSLKRVSRK